MIPLSGLSLSGFDICVDVKCEREQGNGTSSPRESLSDCLEMEEVSDSEPARPEESPGLTHASSELSSASMGPSSAEMALRDHALLMLGMLGMDGMVSDFNMPSPPMPQMTMTDQPFRAMDLRVATVLLGSGEQSGMNHVPQSSQMDRDFKRFLSRPRLMRDMAVSEMESQVRKEGMDEGLVDEVFRELLPLIEPELSPALDPSLEPSLAQDRPLGWESRFPLVPVVANVERVACEGMRNRGGRSDAVFLPPLVIAWWYGHAGRSHQGRAWALTIRASFITEF